MTTSQDPESDIRALTPAPPAERPARFTPYPSDIVERSFQVWSATGRSGARTERLLAREFGSEIAIPSGSTINRWSTELSWAARANGELLQTRGKSLEQLRSGLLASALLAKDTVLDGLCGALDDLPPNVAALRLKAAELSLRVAERSGLLVILTEEPAVLEEPDEESSLTVRQQAQLMRRRIVQENRRS